MSSDAATRPRATRCRPPSAATFVSWRCNELRIDELLDRYFDITANLPEERWRDISTRVHWNGGDARIRVSELFVRASLPDFYEP
jgi:hypothetical protein